MSVRAKFKVQEQTRYEFAGKVKLMAIYDTSTPENERFTKATPSGTLEMQIDNPAALDQFTPGAVFYLDFTPAD